MLERKIFKKKFSESLLDFIRMGTLRYTYTLNEHIQDKMAFFITTLAFK